MSLYHKQRESRPKQSSSSSQPVRTLYIIFTAWYMEYMTYPWWIPEVCMATGRRRWRPPTYQHTASESTLAEPTWTDCTHTSTHAALKTCKMALEQKVCRETHFFIFSRMFAIFPNRFCDEKIKQLLWHRLGGVSCDVELPTACHVSPELSERRPEPAGTSLTPSDLL